MECLFCNIIAGKAEARIVYHDDMHVAFLTPFPNTPGFTVLVTREHLGSNILGMDEDRFTEFMKAARKLALHIETKLGTKRTGLVIEGMGIDHAHIKLIPMHGIPDGDWKAMLSNEHPFSKTYEGFLTTHDGPRMSDEELDEILIKIRS